MQISLPNLIFFTVKSPSVSQRSVSQENALKKSKNLLAFFHKTIDSNNSFTLIENNFRFLFKVTVHYGLWAKCIQLWALNWRFSDFSHSQNSRGSLGEYVTCIYPCVCVKINTRKRPHGVSRSWTHLFFVCFCMCGQLGKNRKTTNLNLMAYDAITQGSLRGVASP